MSELSGDRSYGKISQLGREINKLDIKSVPEGIKIATTVQWGKNRSKIEEKENIVPFIRNNIESINQRNERASGGEER